jgi:hypothetical protein
MRSTEATRKPAMFEWMVKMIVHARPVMSNPRFPLIYVRGSGVPFAFGRHFLRLAAPWRCFLMRRLRLHCARRRAACRDVLPSANFRPPTALLLAASLCNSRSHYHQSSHDTYGKSHIRPQ